MNKLVFFNYVLLILYYKSATAGVLKNENSESDEKCTSICSSKACEEKAKSFMANIDQNVNPCEDFYQFACGNFVKNHVLDENEEAVSQLDLGQKRLDQQLINEVKSEILPNDMEAIKKLKLHFKNCLDEATREKLGATPLLDLIQRLGGWPVLLGDQWNEKDYKWENVVSKISEEGFSPGLPFQTSIYLDPIDSQRHLLQISPSDTGILKGTNDKFIEAYKSYLVDLAVLLGANREKAKIEVKEFVEFEKNLNKAKTPADDLDDVSPLENRKSIIDLNKEYPDIQWLDVINRILSPSNVSITENDFVLVEDSKFMSKIGPLMKNTPKRVIANFQILDVIRSLVSLLSSEFQNLQTAFIELISESSALTNKDKVCMEKVKDSFDIALSTLYVKKYFNHQSRHKVIEMITNIRDETKATLEKIDWMDEYTRKGALKKLETMKILAGYSDELLDDERINNYYKNVKITPGKFFDDVQNIDANDKNVDLRKLNKTADEFAWFFNAGVAIVNAFYHTANHQISIMAGILQEPWFNSEWPEYLNYGGIGYAIGHEITHGFDNDGRKYDHEGNLKDWWNNKTAQEFERKVQCKIDQYNHYMIKRINKTVNGKMTRAENIADAGGVKLAHQAYEKIIKSKGSTEGCLPNFNYTPKQMFWISTAATLCQKDSDNVLKSLIFMDEHSPAEARVNIVFSNNYDFAKDFKCPVGSKMNPMKKCEVW